MKIAVLLTTFNRKHLTLTCLRSLFEAKLPYNWDFEVYITDDNSNDGTVEEVLNTFPEVKIFISTNNLYWSRGMNTSWNIALNKGYYNAFLLLNDDVKLYNSFWDNIFITNNFCIEKNNRDGIYVSSTQSQMDNKLTYGGINIINRLFLIKYKKIYPTLIPLKCQVTNANILFVPISVVNLIGIFDDKYIHGIADFDYSLTAYSRNIPIYITPNFGGFCENNHGNNWLTNSFTLKERINFLKHPKGLAYNEYMYFLFKHFPFYAPIGFALLWLKTFFPFLWTKFKYE